MFFTSSYFILFPKKDFQTHEMILYGEHVNGQVYHTLHFMTKITYTRNLKLDFTYKNDNKKYSLYTIH
jgi:hypothetical protein